MTDGNIHMLAGAYALNALPLEERAFSERHLASCEACREEVADYQATAARLGSAAAEEPPPDLRARVLDAVDQTRQVPRPCRPTSRRSPSVPAPTSHSPPLCSRSPSSRSGA